MPFTASSNSTAPQANTFAFRRLILNLSLHQSVSRLKWTRLPEMVWMSYQFFCRRGKHLLMAPLKRSLLFPTNLSKNGIYRYFWKCSSVRVMYSFLPCNYRADLIQSTSVMVHSWAKALCASIQIRQSYVKWKSSFLAANTFLDYILNSLRILWRVANSSFSAMMKVFLNYSSVFPYLTKCYLYYVYWLMNFTIETKRSSLVFSPALPFLNCFSITKKSFMNAFQASSYQLMIWACLFSSNDCCLWQTSKASLRLLMVQVTIQDSNLRISSVRVFLTSKKAQKPCFSSSLILASLLVDETSPCSLCTFELFSQNSLLILIQASKQWTREAWMLFFAFCLLFSSERTLLTMSLQLLVVFWYYMLYLRKMLKVDQMRSCSACFMMEVLVYKERAGKEGIGAQEIYDFLGECASAGGDSAFTYGQTGGGQLTAFDWGSSILAQFCQTIGLWETATYYAALSS